MTTDLNPAPKSGPAGLTSLNLALFLFLLAVYLLTYTPRVNSSDGLAMFATAESLLRRGSLDIEQIRWMGLQQGSYGLDGLLYSRKGIGLPLALLPLTGLAFIAPWFGPVSASLLFNALVTALTAVLLLSYLTDLGFGPATGLIVGLTFGLATLAWPYAKSLFSDPFSGLLLLAAAYFLRRGNQPAGPRLFGPGLAGLCLGWNVATRYAEALFVPVFGLLLLYYLGRELGRAGPSWPGYWPLPARVWAPLLAFTIPIVLVGMGLIYFNLTRYGDPFNTGYLPEETFSAPLWQGLTGQLVSPGRGLLLYCPVLLLSFAGLLPLWRRARAEAIVALSVILIHLLLYGKWFMWHGGFAWGPRFMIPTLPFWALFLAPVVVRAFPQPGAPPAAQGRAGTLRWLYFGLAGLGLIPQLLSVIIDFGPFQNALLAAGLPLFAPETFFNLQFSPLLKGWAFIQADKLDLLWLWQGRLNGWLLALLVFNLLLTGLSLRQTALARPGRLLAGLAYGVTFTSLIGLLLYAHSLPADPLKQAVARLNELGDPADPVITNDPEIAMPFAELYQGRGPVLGLNQGEQLPPGIAGRLRATLADHRQIWWLPNAIPPEKSGIEQLLLAEGFPARQETFAGQRLLLFALPPALTTPPQQVEATFAGLIRLETMAFPPESPAGVALPVELQWRSLAKLPQDYHVFIHLLDGAGQLLSQADGQPLHWSRPTSTWQPGERLIDRYGLWVPPATATGPYQVRIGLYLPSDGQRLLLANGEDAVSVTVKIREQGR
jgi:hypothetical protein